MARTKRKNKHGDGGEDGGNNEVRGKYMLAY
jgi:hypothetical protein